MITSFLIILAYGLVSVILAPLPVLPLPSAIASGVILVWGYINSVSFLLPVGQLVAVVALAFLFHFTIFGWRLSVWVYKMLRGF